MEVWQPPVDYARGKRCQFLMGKDESAALKSSAPGQYLGFTLQTVRAAFHLLNAPTGSSVSVEHDDDVSVHLPDGKIVLEQCKSALISNPVSDWSSELWKAFANWIAVTNMRGYDPKSVSYRLYVTPAKTGKFVQQMHALSGAAEIKSFVEAIKKKLEAKTSAPECAALMGALFTSSQSLQIAVIENFRFDSETADPIGQIQTILLATVSESIAPALTSYVLGEAQKLVDKKLRDGAIGTIDAEQFRVGLRAFVRKHDLGGLLTSVGEPPSAEMVQALMQKAPRFVQQLELVALTNEMQMRAVSAYLQTSANKTTWGEAGSVFPTSFDEYDKGLVDRHSYIKTEIEDVNAGLAPDVRGRLVYARCCQLSPKLEDREVPSHFVCGSFNSLADTLALGWHPEYKKHFEDKEGG